MSNLHKQWGQQNVVNSSYNGAVLFEDSEENYDVFSFWSGAEIGLLHVNWREDINYNVQIMWQERLCKGLVHTMINC